MALPTLNTFTANTKIESSKVNENFTNLRNRTEVSSSTDHIVITAGTSKLVKITVLRQDDTTNTYTANSVILTGWGFALGHGGAARTAADTITFGITFSQVPIIVAVACGYKDGSDPSSITDFGVWDKPNATVHDLAVGSAQVTQGACDQVTIVNTRRVGYTWIAVGSLA
jgi:hypothetical protein